MKYLLDFKGEMNIIAVLIYFDTSSKLLSQFDFFLSMRY